jgi:hypothetical protein
MHKIFATVILGAMIAAAQTQTQTQPTAAELLQKGIFAQETAGDLEGAAKIFRQIVDSHPIQREIAAQAQYRLGLTLLAKGDAAGASQEIQRLGWDFPDYKELIASAKNASGPAPASGMIPYYTTHVPGTGQTMVVLSTPSSALSHDAEFDFTKSVTVTGTVKQMQFINPYSWLTVNSNGNADTPYRISLASPNTLSHAGWNRDTVKAGDQVIVTGAPALDGSSTIQATSVSANGTVVFK